MGNDEKRFKVEEVEKANKALYYEAIGTLLSGGMFFGSLEILIDDPFSFLARSLIVIGYLGMNFIPMGIWETILHKDSIIRELEEQGIDVKEELKKRKRTKQNN